ncbi:MAG: ASKHA domain-containing protein [Treponema sp.]|nr:ASKHA domain-containing protein [Treponema sp.]
MKIRIKNGQEFEARAGETLLSALGRAGIPVSASCGGKHRCGKCLVRIAEGRIRDILPPEKSSIRKNLPAGTVLACASVPETDITLELIGEHAYEGGAYQKISAVNTAGNTAGNRRTGIALDIGTTTVSARLIDLDSGEELDTYSALNQQRVFGADVMSRIGAAREGKTAELFSIINRQTEQIISGFKEKFRLDSSIETLVVAANTTMLHLFVNEDPSAMGEIPFKPVFLEERKYSGKDLGLSVNSVYLFPSISAFIGADIVSGLCEIDILKAGEAVFFIDIGTNGEMALFHEGKLYCASAAAGPALEGAEISCGVGSIRGAINKVQWIGGKLDWATIDDDPPVGICGCGLIDTIALMLDREIIDETGAFCDDDREDFEVSSGISITNRDVRQYQLAKSAILSAIKIVIKSAGIDLNDVKKVYVAGGLGFYIDRKSAVRSGLLPAEFLDKIEVCGNTSLKGAVRALLFLAGQHNAAATANDAADFRQTSREIVKISSITDLASNPEFMDAFAENMIFPAQEDHDDV